MDVTPQAKVTLDHMASVAGVSRAHLCRLCKHHLGYPPHDILYRCRIIRSLDGLRAGQKIESLAHDSGFSSDAHYICRFKAVIGDSPVRIREAMNTGHAPRLPSPFQLK